MQIGFLAFKYVFGTLESEKIIRNLQPLTNSTTAIMNRPSITIARDWSIRVCSGWGNGRYFISSPKIIPKKNNPKALKCSPKKHHC